MGYFTWTLANRKLQRTRFSILSKCKLPYGGYGCVMCPDGSVIEEKNYEGYGIFDGKDVYELVVDWNKKYLLQILRQQRNNEQYGLYYDIAKAYMRHGKKAAEETVKCYVDIGVAPRYMLTDWKRDLGIQIACEHNATIPFPIKITNTPRPRLPYDKLPASISCQ